MTGSPGAASGQNSGDQSDAISAAEFQALIEMVGEDAPEVMVDLLDTYLEESAGLVEKITEAHQQQDESAMLRPVHSLKSSSASVGAMKLSQICSELEAHLRGSQPVANVAQHVQSIESEYARVHVALTHEREQLLNT